MHPQLTHIAAQQHIADLHRAADQWRWARGGCPPRLATPPPRQLEPRENQVGSRRK
jgi:hypothetical protein